jgi:3-hydroxyisobutyrate dehydrogenase-like beta-hydroxyacid dehydrogenase
MTISETQSVGMIGIGLMGHGIAKHICAQTEYSFHFFEHAGNQPVDDLLAMGAVSHSTLPGLAQAANIVLICVTGANEVQSILFGNEGLADYLPAGSIVIDCSTGLPDRTKQVAQTLEERNIRFADAAMTRTPKEAEEGRLNLIVGAETSVFDTIQPLLGCFSEHITHAGSAGSGQMLKLIHNYVSLGYAGIMAEAAATANTYNIAPERLIEVLAQGGGNSVVLDRFAPYLREGDISRLQFSLSNAAKDIGYFIQSCGGSDVSNALLDQLCRAIEHNGGQPSVLTLTDFYVTQQTAHKSDSD